MSFVTLTGRITKIDDAVIKGNFESRKFVVTEQKERYPNIWIVEAQQGRGNVLDYYNLNEAVICNCEVVGREWTKEATGEVSYFTTLKMLTLQRLEDFQKPQVAQQQARAGSSSNSTPELDKQYQEKYGNGTAGHAEQYNNSIPSSTSQADDLPF